MTSLGLYVCLLLVVVAQATKTTYRKGFTDKDVISSQKSGKGDWTEWLDRDVPGPWGTGEFEDVDRQKWDDRRRGECKMWCDKPIAMEIDLSPDHSNVTTASLDEVLECAVIDSIEPLPGFTCHNSYNRANKQKNCAPDKCSRNGLGKCDICPNVKVRYFCQGSYAEACNAIQQRSLDMEETVRVERGMDSMFRRFLDTDSEATGDGAIFQRSLHSVGDKEALLERMTKEFRDYAARHLDAEETKRAEERKRSSLLSLMQLLEKAIDES